MAARRSLEHPKKQQLIDSILRGWRLPKFYFVKYDEDDYEVVDGQQRLVAIFEFFSNELSLPDDSKKSFGGPTYRDLKSKYSDAFDDFEIDFDEIEEATEEELKHFFQRLQQVLPLRSSEKLNAVHSKLRDYCKKQAEHAFLSEKISVADTRLAHFDIVSKVAAVEIEGLDAPLRFDDLRIIFESQTSFSASSATGKRIRLALDFLSKAFPSKDSNLKSRAIVQAIITFVCRLVDTNNHKGLENITAKFLKTFLKELAAQVELGQAATDNDYIRFQRSVNANVKGSARVRHEVLLRKAFLNCPELADAFGSSAIKTSGVAKRIGELGDSIADSIHRLNSAYSLKHGRDLFKATNKTTQALLNIRKPIKDFEGYKALVDHLYFVFREGAGSRLEGNVPPAFAELNLLRTELRHDVDHGEEGKVISKRKKIGATFKKFSGAETPESLDPARFVLVQANILTALDSDLQSISI